MIVLEWIRFLTGAVCIAAGLIFYVIQFIGVFRFKYVLNRMHAAAIGDTLGCGLLLVGALNYVNTISSGIQNRKLTLSVMESIGMSVKQIDRLLIREGVLYGTFSVLITLTAGSAVTYICFQSMNHMDIPFGVPVIPLSCAIALVMLICAITPPLSYRRFAGNRSVVERLKEYE